MVSGNYARLGYYYGRRNVCISEQWDLGHCSSFSREVYCWILWIITVKVSLNGEVDGLKAQLVAKCST